MNILRITVDYYIGASARSARAAWQWMRRQGLALSLLSAFALLVLSIVFGVRRPTLAEVIIALIGVPLAVLCACMFCFLCADPGRELKRLTERLAEFVEPPDTPARVPKLSRSEKDELLNSLTKISNAMNRQGRRAVNGAYAYLDQFEQTPTYANALKLFESESGLQYSASVFQEIYAPTGGMTNSISSPVIRQAILVAIQQKDQKTLEELANSFARIRDSLPALRAASAAQGDPQVLSAVLSLLKHRLDSLRQYADKTGALIDKTNSRIEKIRACLG